MPTHSDNPTLTAHFITSHSKAAKVRFFITGEEKTFNNCFGFEQGLWWCKTRQLRHTRQTSHSSRGP